MPASFFFLSSMRQFIKRFAKTADCFIEDKTGVRHVSGRTNSSLMEIKKVTEIYPIDFVETLLNIELFHTEHLFHLGRYLRKVWSDTIF